MERQSTDLADVLFEVSRAALLLVSADDGIVIRANQAIVRLTGYAADAIPGQPVSNLLVPYETDDIECWRFPADEAGDAGIELYRLRRRDRPPLAVRLERNTIDLPECRCEILSLFENEPFDPRQYEDHVDGVVILDETGRVLSANRMLAVLTGRRREELVSIKRDELLVSSDRARAGIRGLEILAGQAERPSEYRLLQPNGTEVPVEVRSRRIVWHGRNCLLSIIRDLTEQRRTERFVEGQKQILEMVALGRPLNEILERVVLCVEELFPGLKASTMLVSDDGLTLHNGAAPSLPREYNSIVEGLRIGPCVGSCGTAAWRRQRVIVQNTQTDPLWDQYRELAACFDLGSCWSQPVISECDRVVATLAVYSKTPRVPLDSEIDVVETLAHLIGVAIERAAVQAELARSEARFRQVAENMREVFFLVAADWSEVFYVSPAFEALWGYPVTRFQRYPLTILETLHAEDQQAMRCRIQARIRGEMSGPAEAEFRITHPSGAERWIQVQVSPVINEAGSCYRLAGFAHDITARRMAEAESSRQRRELESILDAVHAQVVYLDTQGRAVRHNRYSRELLHATDEAVRGLTVVDAASNLDNPEQRHRESLEVIRTGQPLTGSIQRLHEPGGDRWVSVDKVPTFDEQGQVNGLLVFIYDITDLKRAEESLQQQRNQLAHLSRLNSMGEMVAELAHELNQPLAAITNYACVCSEMVATGDASPQRLLEILTTLQEQSGRANDIMRRVRTFSTRRTAEQRLASVNEILQDALRLLESDLRHHSVRLMCRFEEPLPLVYADVVQLQQVFVNIIRNAQDAMQEVTPTNRQIVVCTGRVDTERVSITFRDTGPGLSAEVLSHLFDPFFTTRQEGMGIGLSISRSILEAHHGRLSADNAPGGGAVFTVILPTAGATGADSAAAPIRQPGTLRQKAASEIAQS